VSPDQVVLSHSPLRMLTQFHKMRVLVSGQGPVEEVAHKYPVLNQRVSFFFLHYLWMLTSKVCMFCLFSVILLYLVISI